MSIYGKWLQLCKGRFLRIADLGADRSERRLSANYGFLFASGSAAYYEAVYLAKSQLYCAR